MKGFFRSSIFLRRAQYHGGSESGLIFSDSITSGRWVGVWFIRRPQIDLGMCYCVLCCSIFLIISMRHSLKEDCRRLQVSIRMTSLYFQTPNARGEGQSLSSDCITLRPSRSAFHFPVDHVSRFCTLCSDIWAWFGPRDISGVFIFLFLFFHYIVCVCVWLYGFILILLLPLPPPLLCLPSPLCKIRECHVSRGSYFSYDRRLVALRNGRPSPSLLWVLRSLVSHMRQFYTCYVLGFAFLCVRVMFVFPSYDRVGSTTIVDSTKSDTRRQTTLVHVAFWQRQHGADEQWEHGMKEGRG